MLYPFVLYCVTIIICLMYIFVISFYFPVCGEKLNLMYDGDKESIQTCKLKTDYVNGYFISKHICLSTVIWQNRI